MQSIFVRLVFIGSVAFYSSTWAESDLVSFSIRSNGSEIPSNYQIERIQIEQKINQISKAEIVLLDGNQEEEVFSISESKTFSPGSEIDIQLGYDDKLDLDFSCIVTQQKISLKLTGSHLHITCYDKMIRLTKIRQKLSFSEVELTEVFKKILKPYIGPYLFDRDIDPEAILDRKVLYSQANIAPGNIHYFQYTNNITIDPVGIRYQSLEQRDQTDWTFMKDQANRAGLVIMTDRGKIQIAQPAINMPAKLTVENGVNLISAELGMNVLGQFSNVHLKDQSTQQGTTTVAEEPALNKQGNMTGKKMSEILSSSALILNTDSFVREGAVYSSNQKTLSMIAYAALLKSRLTRFQGTVRFLGTAKATVNSLIELRGLGRRFNGKAYVSGIQHHVEAGSWITTAEIGDSNSQ